MCQDDKMEGPHIHEIAWKEYMGSESYCKTNIWRKDFLVQVIMINNNNDASHYIKQKMEATKVFIVVVILEIKHILTFIVKHKEQNRIGTLI